MTEHGWPDGCRGAFVIVLLLSQGEIKRFFDFNMTGKTSSLIKKELCNLSTRINAKCASWYFASEVEATHLSTENQSPLVLCLPGGDNRNHHQPLHAFQDIP
jgi:hypothetical protein